VLADILLHLPAWPRAVLPALWWVAGTTVLWAWLRGELTPKRFLSIWTSDGVLSVRLLGATVLLIWSMCMYSAGRMDDGGLGQVLGWVAGFFAVGGVVKVAGKLNGQPPTNSPE
jgi:hypothetical protein